MQYLKFSFLLSICLCTQISFANDEGILSSQRLKIFEHSEEQNIQNSKKLKKDWIAPIVYTYSNNYDEDYHTSKSMISISQPIFKSGGIYYAVKYANSLRKYSDLDINARKKVMIKDATVLLFKIHQANLSIEKQKLLLKNSSINVDKKKEQVFNGLLDASYLDNAILSANLNKNILVELVYRKEELINSFANLASDDYKTFTLPVLKLVDQKNFIEENIYIKKFNYEVNNKLNLKNIVVSKYLPTANVFYNYQKYHTLNNNPKLSTDGTSNYGFNIRIPLDIRILNDIEQSKLSYLKAKISEENLILEENNLFKSKKAKIEMIDQKMVIAKNDYILYNSLLKTIYEEKQVGLKTQSDVDILKNSQQIKSIEIKLLGFDKQIELLSLYSRLN